jgi:hypothetical protein
MRPAFTRTEGAVAGGPVYRGGDERPAAAQRVDDRQADRGVSVSGGEQALREIVIAGDDCLVLVASPV